MKQRPGSPQTRIHSSFLMLQISGNYFSPNGVMSRAARVTKTSSPDEGLFAGAKCSFHPRGAEDQPLGGDPLRLITSCQNSARVTDEKKRFVLRTSLARTFGQNKPDCANVPPRNQQTSAELLLNCSSSGSLSKAPPRWPCWKEPTCRTIQSEDGGTRNQEPGTGNQEPGTGGGWERF